MKKYYVKKYYVIKLFDATVLIEAESDTEAIEKAKKTYPDYTPFIVGIYEGNKNKRFKKV